MTEPNQESRPPSMPGWLKILLIALLVVAVIGAVAMLVSGGDHGPGRHAMTSVLQLALR